PAYHNLIQRVEKFVERFLNGQKWTSNVNKNQLRETLRRQLNNSGIMSIGVDRIIEQVVNPKILLGIKPRIDEAVCEHLGIDLKVRQEEQQRRKQEKQRLLLQQQHVQNTMNQNVKNDEAFIPGSGILPTPSGLPWSPASCNFLGNSVPNMGPGSGVPYNMGFGGMMQPFTFMGPWGPGLPGMEGFNQIMNPMIPGQPMIPAFPSGISDASAPFNTSPRPAQSTPDFSKPPPGLPGTPLLSSASSITSSPGVPGLSVQSSPVAPPGIHPSSVGPIIRPPPPGSVPPPPGTVPVIPPVPMIPSGTSMAPPVSPLIRPNVPTTPNIPALISHTLSKVSKDELTPEKIAVFKTAAAFITKTVNNAQGTPGADLATMFSPRVLAEAMMAESGAPMTKHEMRAAKRKERMKEFERLKAERDKEEEEKRKAEVKAQEDPLPPKHNLMDVFQAAEDVSDDEESFNMLIDGAEAEDRHKQGIVLSEDSDKEEEQPPTSQPGKRYNFAWDVDKDDLSDVTVSSIHTSDISSFEDTSSSQSESEDEGNRSVEKVEEKDVESKTAEEKESVVEADIDKDEQVENSQQLESVEMNLDDNEQNEIATVKENKTKPLLRVAEVKLIKTSVKEGTVEAVKPRKLVALSYKYSDSDDEETREERKARIAKEKEERYLKRQQRRAEMEAKRKEREDEKARMREEKMKQKNENQIEMPKEAVTDEAIKVEDTATSTTSATEQDSPNKASPRKRRNKAEIKEQLHQQKVQERKAALRRQRTRNRRYTSEEFTSIFTERKTLNQSYTDPPQDVVSFDGGLELVDMMVDQECVVETVGETVEVLDGDKTEDLTLQCPSPYSDISDKSMSDKSDSQTMGVEMEQVSSDEDLDTGDTTADDASKDVTFFVPSVDADESEISHETLLRNTTPSRPSLATVGDTLIDGQDRRQSSIIWDVKVQLFNDNSDKNLTFGWLSYILCLRVGNGSVYAALSSERLIRVDSEKSPEFLDSRRSQRYDVDDLYKPHVNRRRASTPPQMPLENKFQKIPVDPSSDDDKSQKSNSLLSQAAEDKGGSYKLEDSTAIAEEEVGSVKEPVDMMADLELEPVSDEETPLEDVCSNADDDADKEDGEEKDSDEPFKKDNLPPIEPPPRKQTPIQKEEEEDASDEGEIKSDSEEEKAFNQEERERAAHKKPIELVDFGEAEKRTRSSRGYFPDVTDRRTMKTVRGSASHTSYRGGYSWTTAEPSSYISNVQRYPVGHEGVLTSHSKSPLGYDGAESEASSHSRSSVRLRDDVPPPYPIEGVNTRKRRSPVPELGSSALYKQLSPPSPVSSSVSSRSRSSSSSSSRSRSKSSSRSSSHSSTSHSSHHKKKKRRRRSSRNREVAAVVAAARPFTSSKSVDNDFSPIKAVEPIPKVPSEPQMVRERLLSSGHESISSDELPYFPDDEPEAPPSPPKVKVKRRRSSQGNSSSGSSLSSSPLKKRKRSSQSPGKASISSSELIYSPTRLKSPNKKTSEGEKDDEEDSDSISIERPPMSPGRSSISSGELPDYPEHDLEGFSPHHLPVPQEDIDGFQPPLPPSPQNYNVQPPLPPPSPEAPPLPEEEDGEITEETEQHCSVASGEFQVPELVEKLRNQSKPTCRDNPKLESKYDEPIQQLTSQHSSNHSSNHSSSLENNSIPPTFVTKHVNSLFKNTPELPLNSESQDTKTTDDEAATLEINFKGYVDKLTVSTVDSPSSGQESLSAVDCPSSGLQPDQASSDHKLPQDSRQDQSSLSHSPPRTSGEQSKVDDSELVEQSYSLSGSSVSQCTGSPDFPPHPVQSQSSKQMSVDSTLLDNLIEQQRDDITASETSSTASSGSLTKSEKNCAAECVNSEVAQETGSISQTQSLPFEGQKQTTSTDADVLESSATKGDSAPLKNCIVSDSGLEAREDQCVPSNPSNSPPALPEEHSEEAVECQPVSRKRSRHESGEDSDSNISSGDSGSKRNRCVDPQD
ncbi:hypothetical protein Btru_027984, partial [Bulinus truncatus]